MNALVRGNVLVEGKWKWNGKTGDSGIATPVQTKLEVHPRQSNSTNK